MRHGRKNIKYRVILNGRETWSLTSREQQGVSVFANVVLSKISELTETMYEEFGENRKIKNSKIYTPHQTLLQ